MASWLVHSALERAVQVRALARDIVLRSWVRHLTLNGNVNNLQRDDVKPVDRKPTKEGNMQSVKFLVVSSFGLYATLLRQ